MRRLLAITLLVCMLVPAPAQAFTQAQIDSLLGLLTAFNVPTETISVVSSILTGIPSSFVRTVTYLSHHRDRDDNQNDEEEDSGIPDWVPEGDTLYIDPVNGHYWVHGAEVDAAAVFADPSKVVAGQGYVLSEGDTVGHFVGDALAALLENGTKVVDVYLPDVSPASTDVFPLVANNSDDSEELYWTNIGTTGIAGGMYDTVNDVDSGAAMQTPTIPGQYRYAFRHSENDFALSALGAETVESTMPAPFAGTATQVLIDGFSSTDVVQAGNEMRLLLVRGRPAENNARLQEFSAQIPDDAKIHIDLVHQFAWTANDGFVAIDTLLGSDPNTENGWDTTSYDAGNLTSDGYVGGDDIAYVGAARAALVAGATFAVRTKMIEDSNPPAVMSSFAIISADGNDGIESFGNNREVQFDSYGGSLGGSIDNIVNGGVGAINVAALTVTDDKFDLAVNRSSASDNALDASDRPPGNPLVAAIVGTGSTFALQTITIYDPLPTTDGLSELSETGITNTAPSGMHWKWSASTANGPVSGGDDDPSGTMVASDGSFRILTNLSPIDAQGNPAVFEVVDGGDLFSYNSAFNFVETNGEWSGVAPGDHSFTLRATDPGGLYTEQEFTITVTP